MTYSGSASHGFASPTSDTPCSRRTSHDNDGKPTEHNNETNFRWRTALSKADGSHCQHLDNFCLVITFTSHHGSGRYENND